MASYASKWYLLTLNTTNNAVTGIVTDNGSVKEFESEANALTWIQDNYGEEEVILVRQQNVTWSVVATSP